MDKPEDMLYPAATALFVFSALFQTLFMPIMGGIGGFTVLLLLTIKFIIGEMAKKTLGGSPMSKIEEANDLSKMGGASKTGGVPKGGGVSGGGTAAKGNIYVLIIDYLTTPMNQFEKGMLLLGWALWPILFPLVPIVIFLMIKDACSWVGVDWCSTLSVFF